MLHYTVRYCTHAVKRPKSKGGGGDGGTIIYRTLYCMPWYRTVLVHVRYTSTLVDGSVQYESGWRGLHTKY